MAGRRRVSSVWAPLLATTAELGVIAAASQANAQVAVRADHLAIQVADQAATVAFYQRIFGLAELRPALPGPRWLDLGNGFALHIFGGRTAPVADNRQVHLALAVSDLASVVDRLQAARIPFFDFTGKPATVQAVRRDGVRQLFLRDPDGYWIEVNDARAR